MLTELRNALAILVAAEARIHELVDPTVVHDYVRDVAKANAAAIEAVAAKVADIEGQVTELVTLLTKTASDLTPPVPAADPNPAPVPTPEPLPITITPPPAAASSEPSSSEPVAASDPAPAPADSTT